MSGRGIVWERVCNNSRERLRQDGMIAWCRMHPPVLKVGKGRASKRGSFLAVRTGKGPPDWVCVANGLSILGDDKEIHINKEDLEEGIEIFLEAQDDVLEEKRRSKRGKGRKKKKKKKKKGKKDACYHKVKARYSVWPSAYASGALVKCRKVGAANWGTGGKKKK